jgi:hypothetical protein
MKEDGQSYGLTPLTKVTSKIQFDAVNIPAASYGALMYENKNERSKLRGIQPRRPGLMNNWSNGKSREKFRL